MQSNLCLPTVVCEKWSHAPLQPAKPPAKHAAKPAPAPHVQYFRATYSMKKQWHTQRNAHQNVSFDLVILHHIALCFVLLHFCLCVSCPMKVVPQPELHGFFLGPEFLPLFHFHRSFVVPGNPCTVPAWFLSCCTCCTVSTVVQTVHPALVCRHARRHSRPKLGLSQICMQGTSTDIRTEPPAVTPVQKLFFMYLFALTTPPPPSCASTALRSHHCLMKPSILMPWEVPAQRGRHLQNFSCSFQQSVCCAVIVFESLCLVPT